MSRYILDNSLTMTWCFEDEASALTESLFSRLSNYRDSAVVPVLWLYEVVNVVQIAVRRGRISEANADLFLNTLAGLPIDIETAPRELVFASVKRLMQQYNLTAYDAAYLEMAIRHHLPLAALDGALVRAARSAGVPVVTPQ